MGQFWKRTLVIALCVLAVLVAVRLASDGTGPAILPAQFNQFGNQSVSEFEIGRKNYASGKSLQVGQGGTIGDAQKYEKIGSLTQLSETFDSDRKSVLELIASNSAMIQLERAIGLSGARVLNLGIGVPPERFDSFIDAVRSVGRSIAIEIVKNDKTNEYLQLKARRATLEKARAALEELKAGGGSISERVGVQNRLTEIEQQIQDLGVSLGEFDSQNELCTVKLTLREVSKPRPVPFGRRLVSAFKAALGDFAKLGIGLMGLAGALWLGTLVVAQVRRLGAPGSDA